MLGSASLSCDRFNSATMTEHAHTMSPTEAARTMLRAAGLRVTSVRLAALAALQASPRALSVADLLELVKLPTADRVTLYRTLSSLADAGITHKVDVGDRVWRYSLTDHAHCTHEHHVHDHPHLVCDTCGAVECLSDAEVVIRPRTAKASERLERLRTGDVTLHGTCERCGESKGDRPARPRRGPGPLAGRVRNRPRRRG